MNSRQIPVGQCADLSFDRAFLRRILGFLKRGGYVDRLVIYGGQKLSGQVSVGGAKNAVLPLLFSTLLAEGEHCFDNVPVLKDVDSTFLLLKELGISSQREGHQVHVQVSKISNIKAPYDLVSKMRASILCLGPLLARCGQAIVSLPGGCAIGTRPIDQHLQALKLMGAEFQIKDGYVHGQCQKLKGVHIIFDGVTVGGTENVLMAAVIAEGETIIENAAKEPEIADLVRHLNKMGARISGAGSGVLKIEGVECLHPAPNKHTVIPDRIEAGTLLMAGAITGGDVKITQCVPSHLKALTDKLQIAGWHLEQGPDWIRILPQTSFKSVDISTRPYPGFATDLQAQFMALMTQAEGVSVITENIFENRFMHVQELKRLGADIQAKMRVAIVKGKTKLKGAQLIATDLRASASLVLAALVAEKTTTVHRLYHLDRGYEKLEQKLNTLGGKLFRKKD